MKFMGLPFVEYAYFDAETRGVDFEAMKADISKAKKDDIVLLHGCCHNPTGANLNLSQWQEVVKLINAKGHAMFGAVEPVDLVLGINTQAQED